MTTKEKTELDFDYTGNWPECMSADAGHGITVKIMYEESSEFCNPRDADLTNLGVMAIKYGNYELGDIDADDPHCNSIVCPDCKGSGETHGPDNKIGGMLVRPPDCPRCEGYGEVEIGIYEWLTEHVGARVVLPLFIYEHSGMSISAGANMGSIDPRGHNPFDSDAWDTSMVGFIFDTKESRAECGCEDFTPEAIEQGLRSEVDDYDTYLRGECFYYVIEDENGELLDSCGGFLGDEHVRKEAESAAAIYVEHALKREHNNELAARCWRE